MLISVVIPCYRSAKTIEAVVAGAKEEILSREGNDYQFVLVNDCSPDDTMEVIKKLCEADKKIVAVNLSKNYGQANAQLAAFPYIKGDVAVFMDDDGEHPTSELYKLVDKITVDGNDLVFAKFRHKKHGLFKRFTSWLYSKVNVWMGTGIKGIMTSGFFAMNRMCIDSVKKYKSPFATLSAYLVQITKRIANVDIEHQHRMSGKSGYNFAKRFKLWLSCFTNFTIKPLRMASWFGTICAILGFGFGIFVAIRKLVFPEISAGWTSNVALLLFIGGIIMLMLGLLGEYVGRIYMTDSNMVQYNVRETYNEAEQNDSDEER